ncbi:MAG: tetratricopeptide repeat protein [candidate division WS1 bacterium]|nr:tetratricopeptide repeat protein [candidate division WS1 bacterium]
MYAKAIRALVMFAVFGTPLILLFHWITPGALGIKTIFFNLVMLLVFALWVLECVHEGRVVLKRSPLDLPLAAFLLWNLLSVLWTQYQYASLNQFGKYATYSFLYLMVISHFRHPRHLTALVVTIFSSMLLTCAYGVMQFLGYDWFTWFPQDVRLLASLGNATFYAAHLLIMLPLAVNLYLLRRGSWRTFIWGAIVALMYFCLLATYTRAAWLAGLGMMLLNLALLARYTDWLKPPRRAATVSALVLIVALTGATVLVATTGHYKLGDRFASSFQMDMSNVQRKMVWSAALKIFQSHPLLGTGAGTYFHHVAGHLDPEFYNTGEAGWVDHAHNELLEQAADTGIVGVGLALWLVVTFVIVTLRLVRRAPVQTFRYMAAGLLAGGLAFLGQNMAGVSIRYTTGAVYFWLVLGMAGLLATWSEGKTSKLPEEELTALPPPKHATRVYLELALAIALAVVVFMAGHRIVNRLVSDVYLQWGMSGQNMERYGQARRDLLQAIRLNPYSLRAYAYLGALGVETGEYQAALESYLKLQKLHAEYPKLNRGLGETYLKLKRYPEAIAAYKRDAQLEHSPVSQINLAETYAAAGKMEEARRAANDAVRITEEGRPWLHITLPEVYLRRAAILAKLGLRDPVFEDVQRAKDLEPDSEKPYLAMGDIYRGWGRYREAVREYEAARDLKPQDAQAYVFLGLSYAEMKDYERAINHYHTALYINPTEAFTRLNLGLAYMHTGRTEEARATLAPVAQLGAHHPLGAQARAALDKLGPPS